MNELDFASKEAGVKMNLAITEVTYNALIFGQLIKNQP